MGIASKGLSLRRLGNRDTIEELSEGRSARYTLKLLRLLEMIGVDTLVDGSSIVLAVS